jgi:hypothetical protein
VVKVALQGVFLLINTFIYINFFFDINTLKRSKNINNRVILSVKKSNLRKQLLKRTVKRPETPKRQGD